MPEFSDCCLKIMLVPLLAYGVVALVVVCDWLCQRKEK